MPPISAKKGKKGLGESEALRATRSQPPGKSTPSETVRVRPVEGRDAEHVVCVHRRSFPGFLMTRLGTTFLRTYYALALTSPSSIGVVAEVGDRLVGFLVGYLNPPEVYRNLRANKLRLSAAMLPALLRAPHLLGRVGASFRRTNPKETGDREGLSELASVAVDPAYSGRGIGSQLVRRFIADVRERGGRGIYLTTDAEGNEAVNRFYGKLGFSCTRTFLASKDRMMNEYQLVFERSPISER